MTLVIVQKIKNHISLSSDSRISLGNSGRIDFGVKIFSIPIQICSPVNSEIADPQILYNHRLGLAVVGNLVNSYTVKESISEILQNLQYVPDQTDFSMEGLAKVVFKVFKKVSVDITDILDKKGVCEIILSGHCPERNAIRIFKFSVKIILNKIEPFFEEILMSQGMQFFGTGKELAEKIYSRNQTLLPLHILRQAIRSGEVDSVGGGLQYGEFKDRQFRIFGVEDYELNSDGTFKNFLFSLRGINLYRDEFERDNQDFHIAYTFKRPFENEINELLKTHLLE